MNNSEDESDNKNTCEICGKTVHGLLNHNDKHLCKECYMNIFEE